MPNRGLFVSAVVVLLLGIAAYMYLRNQAEIDAIQHQKTQEAVTPEPASKVGEGRGQLGEEEKRPSSDRPKWRMSDEDKQRRAESLSAILGAVNSRGGERGEAREIGLGAESAVPSDQEILKYVREPIGEIRPLLKECYGHALERKPKLGGILAVKFTIVADSETGALVEKNELVAGEGHIQDDLLGECLRETMYALRFSQPKGTGRITITYPMVLSTGNPDQQLPKTKPEDLKPMIEVEGWSAAP